MKKALLLILITLAAFIFSGCDDDCDNILFYQDTVPTAPQGVISITGDSTVYIYWNGLYEQDVYQYIVYRSFDPIYDYDDIGYVDPYPRPSDNIYSYTDNTVANGITYYYAVRAIDSAGQASELSWETVQDTPRPDGEITLYPNSLSRDHSGFNFSLPARVADTSSIADVYMDSVGGVFYLNAGNYDYIYGKIQDVGNTFYFNQFIGYAPTEGWSELGYVELIEGHSYVIFTYDYHYALMSVKSINPSGSVTFDWAYQTDADNPELSPSPDGEDGRISRPLKKAVSINR